MKKNIALLALASAALLAGACSGTEPGPLRVTMSLDRSGVAMRDSVRVTVTVVNASTDPVMVYPASAYGPCILPGFEVFDRAWRPAQEGYYCLAADIVYIPNPVFLAPGGTMQISRWWKPANTYMDGETISPGLYRIRGAVVVPGSSDVPGAARTIHTPMREVVVGD
jgi:hypothetical protein